MIVVCDKAHSDRRKNEAAYWAVRDQLVQQYHGQWIGFADGKVIASGSSPVAVFHAVEASGKRLFLVRVGNEEQPCRTRRVAFLTEMFSPRRPSASSVSWRTIS